MAEDFLDAPEVGAAFEQVRGRRVAQAVRPDVGPAWHGFQALVHRPAVVWADEPTGNLDSESTEAVMALITRLNGGGQTIVMVTHNPAIAAAAGRIVRMRDGRIDARASAGARSR